MANKGFICKCGSEYFSILHSDLEVNDAVHGTGPGTLAIKFKCDECGVVYEGTGVYPVSFEIPSSPPMNDDGPVAVTFKGDCGD